MAVFQDIEYLVFSANTKLLSQSSYYTRYLSSCLFVGCTRSPRSHSYLCSRGFASLPSRSILKSIGYIYPLRLIIMPFSVFSRSENGLTLNNDGIFQHYIICGESTLHIINIFVLIMAHRKLYRLHLNFGTHFLFRSLSLESSTGYLDG